MCEKKGQQIKAKVEPLPHCAFVQHPTWQQELVNW